jgi:hypothetical protein
MQSFHEVFLSGRIVSNAIPANFYKEARCAESVEELFNFQIYTENREEARAAPEKILPNCSNALG